MSAPTPPAAGAAPTAVTPPITPPPGRNRRLEALLTHRVAPLLARLSAPNVVVVSAMTTVTIADAWFVSHLGVEALASLALVFPVQALMQMMSAGAMGGGVSSAMARALGAHRVARAESGMVHAGLIALGMAAVYILVGGVGARVLFGALGGRGAVLEGAVAYGHIAFGGALALWLANTFASVLRGMGNMVVPAATLVLTSAVQVALSGAFTLGLGPLPALGVRGPAVALVCAFALAALALGAYLAAGRAPAQPRLRGFVPRREVFADILKVGAVASGNALLTIATVFLVTRLVAAQGTAALAGYGLGSRLELMLVPLSFGVGAALTVAVGTNFGAAQYARARRIAWSGALVVGAVTGGVGLAAALRPAWWLGHFTADPAAYAFGQQYLQWVGPGYGFFGLGMALYFASQGTGNMAWPFTAGVVRLAVAGGGGALAVLAFQGGAAGLFACVSAGLAAFGLLLAASLRTRAWYPAPAPPAAPGQPPPAPASAPVGR
jgi:Na+-driven multidrug efflux pump